MPDNGRKAFGDIAPALAQYTDDVLFGDVWERPGLKPHCALPDERAAVPPEEGAPERRDARRNHRDGYPSRFLFRLADGEHRLVDRTESFRGNKVRLDLDY
jgi:hypothetical protein